MEKYCAAGQATDDKIVHSHCLLNTKGYKHTLRICNTYEFSTATMTAQMRLSPILHVQYTACVTNFILYFVIIVLVH